MLTATEVQYLRDVIIDLSEEYSLPGYHAEDVSAALEILNSLQPLDTTKVLEMLEDNNYYDND